MQQEQYLHATYILYPHDYSKSYLQYQYTIVVLIIQITDNTAEVTMQVFGQGSIRLNTCIVWMIHYTINGTVTHYWNVVVYVSTTAICRYCVQRIHLY